MAQNRRGRPRLDPTGMPRPAVCVKLATHSYDSAYALAQRKRVSVPQVLRHALERLLREERGGTL
jgi:hypothetical protein